MNQKSIKEITYELNKLRDDFYQSLPTGEIDSFELIKCIESNIKKLDIIIDNISHNKENLTDKEKILELNHKECYIIPESDYGKAEIWRIWDDYLLFEIPTFGGTPMFVESYKIRKIDELIKRVESWT